MGNIRAFDSEKCREARRLLDDFVCGELSIETNQRILAHLEFCPSCRREKEWLDESRKILQESWRTEPVPSDLQDQIRAGLNDRKYSIWLRLAAAALVPVAGLATFFTLSVDSTVIVDQYAAIAEDHIDCEGLPSQRVDLPLNVSVSSIRARLNERAPGTKLLAIRECDIGESHVVHYLFESPAGGRLSIMVQQRDKNQVLVERPGELQELWNDIHVHSSRIQAVKGEWVSLTSMQSDTLFVYLISDEEHPSLEITRDVFPALRDSLLGAG